MRVHADRLHLSPSDVTGFLACEHLTTLSLAHARGEIERPEVENEQAELIFRKGLEHEHAYLESLRAQGLTVLEIPDPEGDFETAARATAEAIHAGQADVIYQGVLAHEGWRGVADFLDAPAGRHLRGARHQARALRQARLHPPAPLLQRAARADPGTRARPDPRAARKRGAAELPAAGVRRLLPARPLAARAFRRRPAADRAVPRRPLPHLRLQAALRRATGTPSTTSPASPASTARRSSGSRPPGSRRSQQLGRAPAEPVPAGINPDSWAKNREQAELQLHARETRPGHLPAARAAARSRLRAPARTPRPATSSSTSRATRSGTRTARSSTSGGSSTSTATSSRSTRTTTRPSGWLSRRFIDLVHERLARFPDLHVYHYAPYEITALKRLMGRYGTRERELDDLLRREVFVDLYRVVRNGLRASRPGYGLKELEHFLDFERDAEVKDGGASIVIFEQWMQTRDDSLLRQIDEYNREDCIATRLLRDWLLERRDEALAQFGPFPLPEPPEQRPIPEVKEVRAELREQLLDAGEELAAQLLDYHDRERKPVWWAFFDRIEMTAEELLEDPEAISGLTSVGEPVRVDRSWAYTLTFPPQEHKIGEGQQTVDPRHAASRRDRSSARPRRNGASTLKRGPQLRGRAAARGDRARRARSTTPEQEDALDAARPLAARRRPALPGARVDPPPRAVRPAGPDLRSRRDERARALAGRSPPRHPGTARLGEDMDVRPADRAPARERQVGRRRLDEPQGDPQPARRRRRGCRRSSGIEFDGRKKASAGNPESLLRARRRSRTSSTPTSASAPTSPPARPGSSRATTRRTLDYLFIDEAGQVSLADALAMGTAARNVVLVGDPQQLDQVIQGTHPAGSGESVLRHLLGDDATVPPDRGLFLERTYRLHPDICSYISEEFYEGRLEPAPVAAERTTPLGTGLRYLAVEHDGHRQESPEEVAIVARRGRAAARGRDHGRGRRLALQRASERAPGGAARASASAPSTSSRGRRRTSSSTRWGARAGRTSRAGSSSCSRATG